MRFFKWLHISTNTIKQWPSKKSKLYDEQMK